MSAVSWNSIAVAGAGTMGRGIAQTIALAGYNVSLYDVTWEILQQALAQISSSIEKGVTLNKVTGEQAEKAIEAISLTTKLEDLAGADVIIEAVPEDTSIKRDLFVALDRIAEAGAIFASNTSSLSINVLAGMTQRAPRFLGLHFFNPAHIMKLVEVISADDTDPAVVEDATAFVESLGKVAVHCKDTPAFIVNRVARPYYGEAFRILGEGVADVRTIDDLMRSIGFPMGPFELVDLVGCDVNFAVTQSVYEAYFHDPKYRPHPIQQRMVESGRLGRKTGRGFYRYES